MLGWVNALSGIGEHDQGGQRYEQALQLARMANGLDDDDPQTQTQTLIEVLND